jgi:hypothetical protein
LPSREWALIGSGIDAAAAHDAHVVLDEQADCDWAIANVPQEWASQKAGGMDRTAKVGINRLH